MKLQEEIKLYILSLAILFLIIFLITLKPNTNADNIHDFINIKENWLPILMVLLMISCEKIRREFEHKLDGGVGDTIEVVDCKSEDYEYLTFLATYIIPFFGFSFNEVGRLLAYAVLLTVIGIIFVKTEKYYANPTLAIFGYRLYKVHLKDSNDEYSEIIAITKSRLEPSDRVRYKPLSKNVFFVRSTISEQ
ncbi:anti-phage protein KwaA [Shewanella algae]|uniref:anti-phage protein KwaA n=1 Tax=Shewanella algae TaxID=38313 RepID=UPI003003B80D